MKTFLVATVLMLPASGSYVYFSQQQKDFCENYIHLMGLTTYTVQEKIEIFRNPRGDFSHCGEIFDLTIRDLQQLTKDDQ